MFLPPYSPDLNPIEIIRAFTRTHGVHALTFAKLKALIRKAAARTQKALWHAVGQVRNLFTDGECYNFFKAAGYETDQTQHALGGSVLFPWRIVEDRGQPAFDLGQIHALARGIVAGLVFLDLRDAEVIAVGMADIEAGYR